MISTQQIVTTVTISPDLHSRRGGGRQMHFHCLHPTNTHSHTQTHIWHASKIQRDTLRQRKSKHERRLPSNPLLNPLPPTRLVEMESYLAKTAAGTPASNISHSYMSQNLLFPRHISMRSGEPDENAAAKVVCCFCWFFCFLVSVLFIRLTWKSA